MRREASARCDQAAWPRPQQRQSRRERESKAEQAESRADLAEAKAEEARTEAEQARTQAATAQTQIDMAIVGLRTGILAVLDTRGVIVEEALRALVLSCKDLTLLQRWLLRALSAGSATEVFSEEDVK